jgi:hypothetical protein
MKTNIPSSATLLLFMAGQLMAVSQETNTPSPAATSVAAPAGGVAATPAEAPTAAPATTPAAQDSVLARLAARRAADAAGTAVADTTAAPAGGVAAVPVPGGAAIPAPVASAAIPVSPPGFADFQIIAHRNIFDPNRRPYVEGVPYAPAPRVSRVYMFSFRSASEKLGKGCTAFFTGDGVPPSGELNVGDPINGYIIKDITIDKVTKLSKVTLADTKSTNVWVLNESWGLTRQDGGAWTSKYAPTTYPAFARAEPIQTQPVDYSAQFNTQPQFFAAPQPFIAYDPSTGITDTTGLGNNLNGGGRQRRGNRGGGNNGGGFGNNPGGGRFGNNTDGGGGFGNTGGGFAAPAATAAPVDPAVLARLAARRAQENQ